MDTLVTRCPACSTAFNVNSQQLASAKGAVRCGSCLQVFKATDHIVNDGLQVSSDEPIAEEFTSDIPPAAEDTYTQVDSINDADIEEAFATEPSSPGFNSDFENSDIKKSNIEKSDIEKNDTENHGFSPDQDSQNSFNLESLNPEPPTNSQSPISPEASANPEVPRQEVPRQEVPRQENLPSWEQYPHEPATEQRQQHQHHQHHQHQEYQELASDLDDDLLGQTDNNHVDRNIAEQLDQELDQELQDTFSDSLDIEAPLSAHDDSRDTAEIVSVDTSIFAPEYEEPEPVSKNEPVNNDFFAALSELAEQSLEDNTESDLPFNTPHHPSSAELKPSEQTTAEFAQDAEPSGDDTLVGVADDIDDGTDDNINSNIDDAPLDLDLDLDLEPAALSDDARSDVFSTAVAAHSVESTSLELDSEEFKLTTSEHDLAGNFESSIENNSESSAPTNAFSQIQQEEPRFTDNDDTEPYRENPDTSHSLPQVISPEPPADDDNELDESWALDMMMKELDEAEDLDQPSKIEQALDQRRPNEPDPLKELLSNPANSLAGNIEAASNPEASVSDDFDSLDLGSELEDALSMDSIRSGNLSLASDSEFNINEQSDNQSNENTDTEALGKTQLSDAQLTSRANDSEHHKDANASDEHINPGQEEPSKSEMIDSIEPEPLEMEFRKEKPSWNWLWGTGAFVALLGAIGQFGWINFDALNREPPYRDAYKIACNYLSCSLPPQIDLSKLKASNLVVRSHPDAQKALVVDMVLLNTAGFEQDFPDIQLTFSDIQGRAIASRIFEPSEYLAGELAGAKRMPTQRPIHLSLDIVDPGNEAVNYKVDVH